MDLSFEHQPLSHTHAISLDLSRLNVLGHFMFWDRYQLHLGRFYTQQRFGSKSCCKKISYCCWLIVTGVDIWGIEQNLMQEENKSENGLSQEICIYPNLSLHPSITQTYRYYWMVIVLTRPGHYSILYKLPCIIQLNTHHNAWAWWLCDLIII